MKFINKIIFFIVLVFYINVFTQNASFSATGSAVITKVSEPAFSMEDCIDYALKHNPNIKIFKKKKEAQKSSVGIEKSSYFPSLSGNSGYNINKMDSSGNQGMWTNNNNYYQLNLSVNQLIWDFGRTNARINMQKYNYEAAGYDLDYQILDTIYNVKINYAAVLAARANEDIQRRAVQINQLNYERTKSLYEEGLKSRIDVVNAEVYLTDSKINLVEAQNTYQSALITLNNSMYYVDAPAYNLKSIENFNFQNDFTARNEIEVSYVKPKADKNSDDDAILTSGIEKTDIIKNYKFSPSSILLQSAIEKAYENRPDIKSLILVEKAAGESLKAVKRTYMPSINASAGYSLQNNNDFNRNGYTLYAGVALPTINAMSIKNQIDQAQSYRDIAVDNIDLLKKNIYFQIQSDCVNMKQLEKRIPLLNAKVSQTFENFQLADGRYTVGLGNFIELQQAQINYNNAQLEFVQAVFNYNKAKFYLERDMGINEYEKPVSEILKNKTLPKTKSIKKTDEKKQKDVKGSKWIPAFLRKK